MRQTQYILRSTHVFVFFVFQQLFSTVTLYVYVFNYSIEPYFILTFSKLGLTSPDLFYKKPFYCGEYFRLSMSGPVQHHLLAIISSASP